MRKKASVSLSTAEGSRWSEIERGHLPGRRHWAGTATCHLLPPADSGGSQQWAAWFSNFQWSHSFCSSLTCSNSPGCFFVFVFVFLKKDSVFVVESRYFKNISKGYNQVMKMLNIIKDKY